MSTRKWWSCVVLVAILPIAGFTQEWVARYNGPWNGYDVASAIAIDDIGNIFVTGTSSGINGDYDYTTLMYDVLGALHWVARYDGPIDGLDAACAMCVDNIGNVYVTGSSWGWYYRDYATIKYNNLGVEQWVARYDGPIGGDDLACAIAYGDDGYVYVTGRSYGSSNNHDYATVKYDSGGIEQWVARYNGPSNSWDRASAIAVDDSGYVYVTGASIGSGTSYDYATVKYDAAGAEVWVARYDGPANGSDCASAIAVSDTGNVYVTGVSIGNRTPEDYATVKYDALGVEQWVRRYDGPHGYDKAKAIALDEWGNIYVTGDSYSETTGLDHATVKYDPSGDEQWVARYNGPASSSDYATSIAINDAGDIYVTGSSVGFNTGSDCTTVKYDSLGATQWVGRYNGPDSLSDGAHSITVDSFGNIYIAGSINSYGWHEDYVTIKYSYFGIQEASVDHVNTILTASPNPFKNVAAITCHIPSECMNVGLKIFDVAGRLVRDFTEEFSTMSYHSGIKWNGSDDNNKQVSSGIYFLHLDLGACSVTKKLVLIR